MVLLGRCELSLRTHATQPRCKTAAKSMVVTFQLLGPIDARQNGRSLPLSGPRRRALLARLLLARGQVVSVDQLLDDVWDWLADAAHIDDRAHAVWSRKHHRSAEAMGAGPHNQLTTALGR